jgi:hypothetical protein
VVEDDVGIFSSGRSPACLVHPLPPGRGTFIKYVEGGARQLTPCYDHEERARRAGAVAAFDVRPPSWDAPIPIKATFRRYPDSIKKRFSRVEVYGF